MQLTPVTMQARRRWILRSWRCRTDVWPAAIEAASGGLSNWIHRSFDFAIIEARASGGRCRPPDAISLAGYYGVGAGSAGAAPSAGGGVSAGGASAGGAS